MRDSIRRLRPMGIADILDETVELYRTSFVLLVGIAAVMYVPYSIFQGWFMMKHFPHVDLRSPQPDALPLIGAMAAGFVYTILVKPFVTGAMTYAISERYLGRQSSIVASFRRILDPAILARMLLVVVGSVVLTTAAVAIVEIVVIACVVVGMVNAYWLLVAIPLGLLLSLGTAAGTVYLMLRLVPINCVIVVESKGIWQSLGRTWNLMKGSILKCFALMAISMLAVAVVQNIITSPTGVVIMECMLKKSGQPSAFVLITHALLEFVSNTVLGPISTIVTILLYYDIRIRKEGFDLELLASELHAKSQQAPVWAGRPLPQEQVTPQLPQEQTPPEEGSSESTQP